MKKRLLIIALLLSIFIPNVVSAHYANTKVRIDVFYKEESDELDTFKLAINELNEEESIKNKYEVIYTKYEDSPELAERAFLYSVADDEETMVYYIAESFFRGFAKSKYYSFDNSIENSLYTLDKEEMINRINTYYPKSYEDLVSQLESGYFDSILYNDQEEDGNLKDDTYNYYEDDEFEELINWFKNDLKLDKEYKKYLYVFLISFTILYGLKVLNKSIHKNH